MLSASDQAPSRPFFTKRDLMLTLLLLLIALVWLFISAHEKGTECEIYLDGTLIKTISLSEDLSFSLEQVPEVSFTISDGTICFFSSDCPDQTCVRTGRISKPGEYAVCLPHRLMIRIPGAAPSDVDGVTGMRERRLT